MAVEYPFGKREPVCIGQIHVEDQQIEAFFLQPFDTGGTIACRNANSGRKFGQDNIFEALAYNSMIVGQKDLHAPVFKVMGFCSSRIGTKPAAAGESTRFGKRCGKAYSSNAYMYSPWLQWDDLLIQPP